MTDLQLATLLDHVGGRLETALRAAFSGLQIGQVDDPPKSAEVARSILQEAWQIVVDLHEQSEGLRGRMTNQVPEL